MAAARLRSWRGVSGESWDGKAGVGPTASGGRIRTLAQGNAPGIYRVLEVFQFQVVVAEFVAQATLFKALFRATALGGQALFLG